ncbi:MAG: alpha/beta hydrolase [Pseudomonadota bacterium]
MHQPRPHRISSAGLDLAVEETEGNPPSVLWLSGFRSDMTGGKAVTLAHWGARVGRRVVRFDYRGHGASGGKFEDFAISDWLADTLLVYDRFCEPGTVVVGSSMGGWIGLLLAQQAFRDKKPLGGLVLIAPAADFTERLMWPSFTDAQRDEVMETGKVLLPSEYDEPTPITRYLIEDGRKILLYGDDTIETGCPVHILQGVEDTAVPFSHALELVERLARDDVVLTLIKDGDHRLSRDEDLERLISAVEGIGRER